MSGLSCVDILILLLMPVMLLLVRSNQFDNLLSVTPLDHLCEILQAFILA